MMPGPWADSRARFTQFLTNRFSIPVELPVLDNARAVGGQQAVAKYPQHRAAPAVQRVAAWVLLILQGKGLEQAAKSSNLEV